MARAVVEALIWEGERARKEFADFARSLPLTVLERQVEGEQGSVKGIVAHVCRAAYFFLRAVLEANQLPVPTPGYPAIGNSRDLGELFAALDDVRDFTFRGARVLEDRHLATQFTAPWGQVYSCEQFLEHALVHILRHRRQLERVVLGAIKSWEGEEA